MLGVCVCVRVTTRLSRFLIKCIIKIHKIRRYAILFSFHFVSLFCLVFSFQMRHCFIQFSCTICQFLFIQRRNKSLFIAAIQTNNIHINIDRHTKPILLLLFIVVLFCFQRGFIFFLLRFVIYSKAAHGVCINLISFILFSFITTCTHRLLSH